MNFTWSHHCHCQCNLFAALFFLAFFNIFNNMERFNNETTIYVLRVRSNGNSLPSKLVTVLKPNWPEFEKQMQSELVRESAAENIDLKLVTFFLKNFQCCLGGYFRPILPFTTEWSCLRSRKWSRNLVISPILNVGWSWWVSPVSRSYCCSTLHINPPNFTCILPNGSDGLFKDFLRKTFPPS